MEYLVAMKEKADAAKELKEEERFKKAFALQEERIRMERERMEFKREMEEESIMNIDMSTLSYKQQQYYERRQDEIIAKRMNN
jgi:ribonucleotide monophosphatase NagD (HAD superfamily)